MKQKSLVVIIILVILRLILTCGCTAQSAPADELVGVQEPPPAEVQEQATIVPEQEEIAPLYVTGDVVIKDETGYLIILAVNNGTYTIRWTTQDAGESVPGHFEVSEPEEIYPFELVHEYATGVYKHVDISRIDEKDSAFAEQQYTETIAESKAAAQAAAEAIANHKGALPGTYFEVSASHVWDATVSFDGKTSSRTGHGSTRINVPEGTEFAQCILDLDFKDFYQSGSDSGWVEVILYGPYKELLEESSSHTGSSSYVHVSHSF